MLASGGAYAAFDACRGLITDHPDTSRELNDTLKLGFEVMVDETVRTNSPDTARALLYYSRLENADQGRLRKWQKVVDDRDRAAKAAAASARAADRATLFASAEVQAGVARLRSRHTRVIGQSADEVEAKIFDFAQTFGAFSVAIEGHTLRLMMDRPQLSDIAVDVGMIADVFISWCNCDGVTEVWWDRTYVGGSQFPIAMFRYEPRIGHSALVRPK